MPTHHPKHPPPPLPTRIFFDPFNSSSTGHQIDKNRLSGSTSWRDSRTHKLSHQFKDKSGRGGGQHLSDLVGAGSENFGKDGRKDNGDWEVGAPGLRENGWQDIRELMTGNRKRSSGVLEDDSSDTKRRKSSVQEITRSEEHETPGSISKDRGPKTSLDTASIPVPVADESPPPQIFRNLTIYLNGSTAPLISDLKLKTIFAQHGGYTSLGLARRTVTHVILGDNSAGGGGLASRKIQKEVSLVRGLGKGVKYVTAQWIVDSVQKGVRLPESKYIPGTVDGKLGGSGQKSVRAMFRPTD